MANQPGGGPFDLPKFFNPSIPSPSSSVQPLTSSTNFPNPSSNTANPNLISPQQVFPLPSASSYPPPAGGGAPGGGGGGPYSFQHPNSSSSPFHHNPPPQFIHPFQHQPFITNSGNPPPALNSHEPPPPSQFSNHLNPYAQRSMSFPTPPLQPPMTTGPHPGQFPNPQNLSNGNNANNNSNQTHGARLMAMLSGSPSPMEMSQQTGVPLTPLQPTLSGGSDLSASHSLPMMVPSVQQAGFTNPGPTRMLSSSKLPKGRHLVGPHAVYDIDARLPGEVQPQLEVTPITKYGSDPGLVLGRQIAVNKTYICYGLKQGAVRVLNINTALRSLFKGLAQRVTDMAFFAEDVHLLASASVDGRVYVWKIAEDQDEEDKPQITGRIVIAVQFNTEGQSVHPRICWHCHKQEVLVVGIGRHVLKIDTTKVGKGEVYSAEDPLRCPIDRLIDGIQLVGSHDEEVTDLSMCQWMTTRLVSASVDGTVKIWEDRKTLPIAILRPHDGQPVNSVTFLTASHRPDHIILITGGPLNREVKIWVSASDEGWLLPSDSESWRNIQTLELKSSAESHVEEAFFNQVVVLPQAGLLLLANAKKNAIYAVHLDFGSYPASSRMDYVAEFTVTMPILSFTGTSDILPHGEQIVQVYCVQTQAIQQYALDLSQCLPPPIENPLLDKSDWGVSRDAMNSDVLVASEPPETKATEMPVSVSAQASKVPVRESGIEIAAPARQMISSSAESLTSHEFPASTVESKAVPLPAVVGNSDLTSIASPSLPSSPRLSRNLSGLPSRSLEPGQSVDDTIGNSKVTGNSVERQMDGVPVTLSDVGSTDHESRNDEDKVPPSDISASPDHHVLFTHPTHLVTPSEILMANSSSEVAHVNERVCDSEVNIQDVVTVDDPQDVEVDVKVVGETSYSQNSRIGSHEELHTFGAETKEKTFYSQASDLGMQMVRECHALSPANYIVEESRQVEGVSRSESLPQPSASEEDAHDTTKDVSGNFVDSDSQLQLPLAPTPSTRGKKQTGKDTLGSVPFSPSPNAFNSTDSSNDVGASSSIPSLEAAFSQIMGMQDTLNQLVNMQKEMQKQMNMIVAVPVTKEGRRLEAALGKNIEKSVKANNDALWARFQEDNAKQEKSSKERNQQMASLINTCLNKDLPTMVEKTVKKELASLGQAVARTIAPTIEKAVSSSITESFQKGVADKAVNQLEKSLNSKLESTVARQIQAQFQTTGKQALQESLKSNLESSVIPAFEMSCKAMFEQVDAAFQKGMSEHATAALQQFDATHSTLALALRDALNSASSVGQILSSELADGQRKLVALAVAGASSQVANPLVQQISNGSLGGLHEKPEVPLDPTKELTRLIAERKYEEAFSAALQRSDVSIVSWLCSQVDLAGILTMNPLPLSQGVLLSLLQQLACDIVNESPKKLLWMRDVVTAINPSDPMIAVHVRRIFQQVYSILDHRRSIPTIGGSELSNIRLILHVINSMLMTSK